MISIDGSKIKVNGCKYELFVDACTILHELYTEKILDDNDLELVFKYAKMSSDDLQKEAKKKLGDIESHIEFLDTLLKVLKEGR